MTFKDPIAAKAYKKAWYAANKEKDSATKKHWYAANKEAVKVVRKCWYETNKEKKAAKQKAWREANPHLVNSYASKRRAVKLRATPSWANREAIKEMYAEAVFLTDVLGEPYHVDHVVPLVSKIVCGLHCEQNLRVIEGVENKRKSNSHWPDMP